MGSLSATDSGQVGPYDRYTWRQAPDGQWYRDADEVEKFYATFSRKRDDPEKAGFPITASAFFQLSTPDSAGASSLETTLRQAWVALRSECPTLASWIQFDKQTETWRRVYESPSSTGDANAALDKWVSFTFRTVKTSISPSEWINTDPPTLRSPVLYLVLPEEASQTTTGAVFLRCPHDLIDGLGLLQLVDRLFDIASDIHHGKRSSDIASAADSEIKLLAPPMPVATGMAGQLSPEQQKRYDSVKMEAIMSQLKMPQLGLPMDMTNLGPGAAGGVRRVAAVLPQSSSERLLTSCKKHGLTATHVLSAGLVLALRDLQPQDGDGSEKGEPKTLRYHAQALANLRGLFAKEAIPSSVAMAAGNHHMLATTGFLRDFVISADKNDEKVEEFMSVAQQFRDYYASIKPCTDGSNETGRDNLDFAPHTWDMYTPKPPPPQQAASQPPPGESAPPPEPPKLPTSAPVAVSSIGNISSVVKAERHPFKITSAWISAQGMGPSIPVLIQTWDGRVGLSACYEGMFHKGGDVESFLKHILKGTLNGMGLAEDAASEDFLREW